MLYNLQLAQFFESVSSLIYDTIFRPPSDTLFDFLKGVYAEIHATSRGCGFRKLSFKFLKTTSNSTKHCHYTVKRSKRTQNS